MILSQTRAWPRLFAVAALGFALLGAAGCKKGRATVRGRVIFMDQPLTMGTVNFIAPDNRTGQATIEKDGNYAVNDAPLGDVKVFITVPPNPIGPTAKMPTAPPGLGAMMAPEGMAAPSGSGNPGVPDPRARMIPEKYKSADSTPLSLTVKRGENTFDIRILP